MNGGNLNFICAVTGKNLHKDISIMANELKDYCKEHGYDNPKFWPASCTKDYAVSICVRSNDLWEEFEASVVCIIGEYRNNEAKYLGQILKELQEPIVLTVPIAVSANKQTLYRSHGFSLMPTKWTDENEREFEVLVKGSMKMGGFVNLMERVESISGHVVAIRRPLPDIFLSFLTFKLSKVLC
jgi:hypothetical protein